MLFLSVSGLSSSLADSKKNIESTALFPGLRDSTVTGIAPVQQEYGVGELSWSTTNPPQCHADSKALGALFGNLLGGGSYVWIVWDMTALPQGAEIVSVEIEHELEPWPDNPLGMRIQYRSLGKTYLPPPDCWIALQDLQASSVYTDVEMGAVAGTRRYMLGDSAKVDVAGAVGRRGYFSVWIRSSGSLGAAVVPGWSAGGPELIVTWRSPVAVKRESWGTIKMLFSRP